MCQKITTYIVSCMPLPITTNLHEEYLYESKYFRSGELTSGL